MLRHRNIGQLYQGVAALTPARTTAEWVAAFSAASIPAIGVRDIGDIRQNPHLQAVGFFQPRQHPTEGAYYDMKAPVRFGADQQRLAAMPARLGEHSGEIRDCLWSTPSNANS